MANPMPGEEQIYERIKRDNVKVDYEVWELLNHHIRNDTNAIAMALGTLRTIPPWILKAASMVMFILHKITFQRGEPPLDLIKTCDVSLKRVKNVGVFLKKMRDMTVEEKSG